MYGGASLRPSLASIPFLLLCRAGVRLAMAMPLQPGRNALRPLNQDSLAATSRGVAFSFQPVHRWPQLGLQQTRKSAMPSLPLAVAYADDSSMVAGCQAWTPNYLNERQV
ncbi:hypothetical protein SEVIR_3G092850v4 [Setaria viridis]